jgi:hypothetical protein
MLYALQLTLTYAKFVFAMINALYLTSYLRPQYSHQEVLMVTETPELYRQIVRPYIDSFPTSRTQW